MFEGRNVIRRAAVAGGLTAVLGLALFAQDAGAQGYRSRVRTQNGSDGPGVSVKVSSTVADTVSRLSKMVADNEMMVMGELHQGRVLAMTGLKVESETIFVGNPNIGKQLFSEEPGVGLVVPIRINVYADANGDTVVRYIPPSHQLDTFGNGKVNRICRMLDKKLETMVAMLPK